MCVCFTKNSLVSLVTPEDHTYTFWTSPLVNIFGQWKSIIYEPIQENTLALNGLLKMTFLLSHAFSENVHL